MKNGIFDLNFSLMSLFASIEDVESYVQHINFALLNPEE